MRRPCPGRRGITGAPQRGRDAPRRSQLEAWLSDRTDELERLAASKKWQRVTMNPFIE